MITVTVTSDSSVPELRVAERTLADLIKLAIGKDMENSAFSAPAFDSVKPSEHEVNIDLSNYKPDGTFTAVATFNATELAESEQLGKPVCSTVDASQSTTAHVDTTGNTSLPAPTSVFGQPAQTTANEVNPVAQTTNNPVLDAKWLPWDERIHSSSKEFVKDGTWRKRRGVSDELVRSVEAELVGGYTSVVGERHDISDLISESGYAQVTPTVGDMTFTELLDGVTKAMVAGQLSQQRINEALQSIGLTALPNLLGNTALIPAFREALGGVV